MENALGEPRCDIAIDSAAIAASPSCLEREDLWRRLSEAATKSCALNSLDMAPSRVYQSSCPLTKIEEEPRH